MVIREEFSFRYLRSTFVLSVYFLSRSRNIHNEAIFSLMKVTLSTDWQRPGVINRVANLTPWGPPGLLWGQATSSCNAHPTLPTQDSPTPGPSSQQRNERHHLFLSSWYRAALCRETASPKGVRISPDTFGHCTRKAFSGHQLIGQVNAKDNQPGWTFLFIFSVPALGHNLKVQWVSPHPSPSPASNQNKTTQPFPWKLHSLQKGQVQKPHQGTLVVTPPHMLS